MMDLLCQIMWKNTYVWYKNLNVYLKYRSEVAFKLTFKLTFKLLFVAYQSFLFVDLKYLKSFV